MNPLEHSAKTPSETVAILRHLDGWPVQSHSRKKVQEAIDAAIEMIDRLEAAEAECLEQALLNGMGSEREAALMAKLEAAEKERDECNRHRLEAADHFAAQTALMKKKYDDLRAKVEAMEQQQPVKHEFQGRDGDWYPFIDQRHYENTVADGSWPIRALYALPGAKGE